MPSGSPVPSVAQAAEPSIALVVNTVVNPAAADCTCFDKRAVTSLFSSWRLQRVGVNTRRRADPARAPAQTFEDVATVRPNPNEDTNANEDITFLKRENNDTRTEPMVWKASTTRTATKG
jgi:hypothetical protein